MYPNDFAKAVDAVMCNVHNRFPDLEQLRNDFLAQASKEDLPFIWLSYAINNSDIVTSPIESMMLDPWAHPDPKVNIIWAYTISEQFRPFLELRATKKSSTNTSTSKVMNWALARKGLRL